MPETCIFTCPDITCYAVTGVSKGESWKLVRGTFINWLWLPNLSTQHQKESLQRMEIMQTNCMTNCLGPIQFQNLSIVPLPGQDKMPSTEYFKKILISLNFTNCCDDKQVP